VNERLEVVDAMRRDTADSGVPTVDRPDHPEVIK